MSFKLIFYKILYKNNILRNFYGGLAITETIVNKIENVIYYTIPTFSVNIHILFHKNKSYTNILKNFFCTKL